MAIDAVIERIRYAEPKGSLRLELAPRVDRDGIDTIPGRPSLTILGARTFEPQVGWLVWGGADQVEVGNGHWCDRKGTGLRERRPCPDCQHPMHWAEISNTETGERRECYRCDDCGRELPLDPRGE